MKKSKILIVFILIWTFIAGVFVGEFGNDKGDDGAEVGVEQEVGGDAVEKEDGGEENSADKTEGDAQPEATPEVPRDQGDENSPFVPDIAQEMATPHFRMEEYRCDCPGYCDGWPAQMAPTLLEKIEALRCTLDTPVIITSGVRCTPRNEEVGGVPYSFHKHGAAADLYSPGIPLDTLIQTAKACGLNVLPYYASGYVHVEVV